MAYTRSFAQLSLAVQQLGQWEGSIDITPVVLLQAINYALLDGYDHMVQKWADYYTLDRTFSLTSGLDTYPLANIAATGGFYKLRHLDYTPDAAVTASSRFTRMLPHEIEGAHVYAGVQSTSGRPPRYRIQGANLVLAPVPPTGTVRIYYIPLPFQFVDVDDVDVATFDVPTEERLVVHLAQRDLLMRSDLDTSGVDRTIGDLTMKLRTAADSRDAGEPMYLDPRGPPRDFDRGGPDGDGWF